VLKYCHVSEQIVAPSAQALIADAERHRDELLVASGNFETRCDELRDSMQFDALVTLLRGEEEQAVILTQLATALLCATGDAEQAMAVADKALEMAAGDDEELFNGHTARGLIQCAQLLAEPAASSFKAALDLAKAKVEMPKHTLARTKRLSGSCSDALELVEKATMRRDGKTAENFLELGNCRAACYTATLGVEAIPAAGGKEAKQWNAKCLDLLVEAHQAFESAATKMAKVGGHAVALASDAAVLEEIYLFQQMRRLDEVVVKVSEKKEDKNTIEGFCFVDPQGEINAICKNAGHYEKLTDEQQLKCLEEEYATLSRPS
jgi:tetratricopeptide (TPR) repeat protein